MNTQRGTALLVFCGAFSAGCAGLLGLDDKKFEGEQLPSGEVISVRLKKSSGNTALDSAVERAILKSSPLPRPEQSEVFDRLLNIPYRPRED